MPSIRWKSVYIIALLFAKSCCATEDIQTSIVEEFPVKHTKSEKNDNIVRLKSIDTQSKSIKTIHTKTSDDVTGIPCFKYFRVKLIDILFQELFHLLFVEFEILGDKSVRFQLHDSNDPTSNISCFECDSNVSPDCLSNPHKTETCVSQMNECFTILSATAVMRGCIQTEHFITIGQKRFDKCSDRSNCNDQPIHQEHCHVSIVPITQAKSASTEPSKGCPIDFNSVGCYHFVDYAAGLVKKGCIADLSADHLNSLRENLSFKTCLGNDCNSRSVLLSCASFVSKVHDDIDVKTIPTKVCKKYDDECYTHGSYWTIEWGCLSDASDDIKQNCASNHTKCQKCATSYCNMHDTIPEEHCYTLTYKKTDSITLNAGHSKRCYFAMSPMGCYHVESSNGSVRKGCVADLSATEVEAYSKKPNEYITCTGNNCNSRHTMLSCLSCKSKRPNDECALNQNKIALKVCRNYHDKCYARISVDSYFERGCLGDASKEVASDCSVTTVVCKLCNNKNGCNDQYVRERCLEQQYKKGSAVIVTSNTMKKCSLQSKPSGCYHFEDKTMGMVRKGCVGDLTADELSDYIRQQPYFQRCFGDSCNWRYELFSCLSCTSTLDSSTCLSDIQHIDRVLCDRYQDQCFLRATGDQIQRGCLSTAITDIINDCRTDRHKCMTCDQTNNCNDQVKRHEHCYTLNSNPFSSSANELVDKQPTSMKCSLSTYPLGCYHFENAERRIVRKGCVSDLRVSEIQSYQQQQQQFFMKCLGDNCNSGSHIISCLACESNGIDGHCVTNFTNAVIEACPMYGDKCYTRITTNNQYKRGCLSKASEIVTKACDSKLDKCEVCDTNKCNDHIAANHCVSCDSEFDRHCQNNPDKITKVLHCSMKSTIDKRESAGCFLKFRGKNVIRGCVEDLSAEDAHTCSSSNSNKCQACTGHRCNERVSFHQSCFKCKSSVQSSCLEKSNDITAVRCMNYSSSCLVGVDSFGHTHRTCGYGERENKDNFPFGYESCNGEECNDFVFPNDRLYCYRCEDSGKKLDVDQHMGICQVYSITNHCYTYENGWYLCICSLY